VRQRAGKPKGRRAAIRRGWLALALLWMMALVVGNGVPGSSLPDIGFSIPHRDKLQHFIAWMLLSWWWWRAVAPVAPGQRAAVRMPLLFIWLLPATFGVIDEFRQQWVPYRSAELADLAADFLGSATAVAAAWWSTRHRRLD